MSPAGLAVSDSVGVTDCDGLTDRVLEVLGRIVRVTELEAVGLPDVVTVVDAVALPDDDALPEVDALPDADTETDRDSLRVAVKDRDSLRVTETDRDREGLTVLDGVADATSHVKQPNV